MRACAIAYGVPVRRVAVGAVSAAAVLAAVVGLAAGLDGNQPPAAAPTTAPTTAPSTAPTGVAAKDSATPAMAADPQRVDLDELRPSIRAAPSDRAVIYTDGCHAGPEDEAPQDGCVYGDPDGERVIVAVGDSHMAHWWEPLNRTAQARGARLLWFTKSACPAVDITISLRGSAYAECDAWRSAVFRQVAALERVDVAVAASSYGKTILRRDGGGRVPGPQRAAEWQAGTARLIAALGRSGAHVVVIRDTPRMGQDQPRCLAATDGDAAACAVPRQAALPLPMWRAEQAAVAQAGRRASTLDLTDDICGPTACGPVTPDRVLRWRDSHHLTSTFAALLTPRFEAAFAPYLS